MDESEKPNLTKAPTRSERLKLEEELAKFKSGGGNVRKLKIDESADSKEWNRLKKWKTDKR